MEASCGGIQWIKPMEEPCLEHLWTNPERAVPGSGSRFPVSQFRVVSIGCPTSSPVPAVPSFFSTTLAWSRVSAINHIDAEGKAISLCRSAQQYCRERIAVSSLLQSFISIPQLRPRCDAAADFFIVYNIRGDIVFPRQCCFAIGNKFYFSQF